jgi:cytochrome bd-type quinol oxidase subunit 2
MVTLLAESGIALRAGQHCAQPLLAALGVSGTLRASFAPYNTQSDVEALVAAVDRALLKAGRLIQLTLNLMTYVACVFVPIILLYTSWCYWKMFGRITKEHIESNTHSMY